MFITPEYLAEQRRLHTTSDSYLRYGDRGYNWAYTVVGVARIENCSNVLDYGCGGGSLVRALASQGIKVQGYDPAVEDFTAPPRPADLLVTLDALEHIEPELLDRVLDHIAHLCLKRFFAAIATRPAKKVLSDGRNAHLIIEDNAFWRAKFEERGFEMRREWKTGQSEWVALMNAPKR